MSRFRHSTFALALGALLGAACQEQPPGPTWIALAQGFQPSSPLPSGEWRGSPWSPERAIRVRTLDGEVWCETKLVSADWRAAPRAGLWWTTRPFRGFGIPADGKPHRLEVEGQACRHLMRGTPEWRAEVEGDGEELEQGGFVVSGDRLYLYSGSEAAPEEATYGVFTTRGESVEGTWRVHLEENSAVDGLPVWPGMREELRTSVPPARSLRFATAVQGAALPRNTEAEVVFRVLCDGELLFEHRQPLGSRQETLSHELPLQASRESLLAFEVEGPAVLSAFLRPMIVPANRGTYGDRPWGDGRPNIVLFLADTFRADNMGIFGGRENVTPNLDAHAARALAFSRAWSTSTWTLPAHGSMFTGLFPDQHTATRMETSLPLGLVTIAEKLREAGYRTCAKTDAGWVTQSRNIDQGFEWFIEAEKDLEETESAARRFLDDDDGRPLFLFLHTYHTHHPFRVSDQTLAEHGQRFTFVDTAELSREWFSDIESWLLAGPLDADHRQALDRQRDLYLGTVIDLDRTFGELMDTFENEGLLKNGYVVFTSDHGEAFYEHETISHGLGLWEESIRVPLFLQGPGLEPRLSDLPASLVDLPHTLAQLARIEPDPSWLGQSLVTLAEERPMFSFECSTRRPDSRMAILERGRKLITRAEPLALAEGAIEHAYDLARDPGEHEDAADSDWARELARRLGGPAARLLQPIIGSSTQELSPADAEQLRALGY